MPRFVTPFKIQLPVITLPVSHGGQPAIAVFSMTPRDQPELCLVTAIDREGRGFQSVPMHISVLRAAALNPMTFIETDDRIVAPKGGIIVPGQP